VLVSSTGFSVCPLIADSDSAAQDNLKEKFKV